MGEFREGILIFFVTVFGLGTIGSKLFLTSKEKDLLTRVLTGIGVGVFILIWASMAVILLSRLWPQFLTLGSILLLVFSLAGLVWSSWRNRMVKISKSDFLGFGIVGLLFLGYLLLRLAFLRDLVFPPYDDSTDHYMIIGDLLSPAGSDRSGFYSLGKIFQHYYHLGFHMIAAWLISLSNLDIAETMIILGQLFLSISPLFILLLILIETQSLPAGITAAIFAAVAWKMPAFAANWGKYPAIAGLALFPAWIALLEILRRGGLSKFRSFFLVLGITTGLGLMHTRLLVCMFLVGLAILVSWRMDLQKVNRPLQISVLSALTIVVLSLFWKPLLVFYSNGYYLSLVLLVLLLPFGINSFPRYLFGIEIFMFGVWLASRTPVLFFEGGTGWLDAPFIQLLLYIPLSLAGGLGFAGLLQTAWKRRVLFVITLAIPATVLIGGLVTTGNQHPDVCCNYMSKEDISAINWIDENTPTKSVFWISGFKPGRYWIGTDAGIWIFPLTGRNVNKIEYNINWDSPDTALKICRPTSNDVYIYKGGMTNSFDEEWLEQQIWVRKVFVGQSIRIYQALCQPG